MSESENHEVERPASIRPVQQMISSCTGAFITSFLVTPLDVVKIRLQSQSQPLKQGSCFIYCNGLLDCLCMCSHCNNGESGKSGAVTIKPWYNKPGTFTGTLGIQPCRLHANGANYEKLAAEMGCTGVPSTCISVNRPNAHFTGTLDAFIKIARYEGLSSLWSGLPPTLIMSVPATVFYFTTYDHLKYYMGYREKDPRSQYIPLLAGSTARVGTCILISPIELIRTKMQSEQLSYRQVAMAVRVSVQHGGVLTLMRGVGPMLFRDVPFSALYWFGYEYVKSLQLHLSGNNQVTFTQSLIAGATSGMVAGLLTLPFDVVKTHRQIQLGRAQLMKDTKLVPTYTLMAQLYRRNGMPALFTGWVPRVVKVAPACAIMISSYEYFKAFFRNRNAQRASDLPKSWT